MQKSFLDFIPLEEGVNDPGIFKAVFLAGGPGSGKSFIVGQTALSTFGLKTVNSDDAFENALKKAGAMPQVAPDRRDPEKKAITDFISSPKGQAMRDRAKLLTAKRQDQYIEGRLGLVIDGTGKKYDKVEQQKKKLEALGYQTMMIFVNSDRITARKRNANRSRTIDNISLGFMWQETQKNIGKFQNLFGNDFVIIDNSEGSDYQSGIMHAYRKVGRWVKTPANHIAKRWIKSQKQSRGIKEGKEHSWKSEGHYTKDGKEWTGPQHAHDGQVMTGEKHTDDSQNLYHFKELPKPVQQRLLAKMKLKEDLRKWFGKGKEGDWVRVGTDGEIKGDCAREPGEGKPKCMPRSKAHSMDKDDRATSARRKRREDPVADRKGKGGKPIMVKTDVDEACWDGWKKKGMKKKGDRIVPNCVKEDGTIMYEKVKDMSMGDVIKDFRQSDAPQFRGKSEKKRTQMAIAAKLQSQKEGYTLPKLKPTKSLEQRRQAKRRESNKPFDAKIKDNALNEAPRWMMDPLARTVHRMQYKTAAKLLKQIVDRKKKEGGGKLRHGIEYYAATVARQISDKVDARTLAKMVSEGYDPVKHEWGTDAGRDYYLSLTPGQKKKKIEDIKPVDTPIKENCGCEEDDDWMEYLHKIELSGFSDDDIAEIDNEIDSLTFDDMVDMGLYDDDELEEVEVDVHDDINITEEQLDEVLSIQGRMKRRFNARRNRQKLKVARMRRSRMASDPGRIKMRAARGARVLMKKRLARGRDMGAMPPAEKARIETLLKRFQPLVTKMAQRMIPQVRKAEMGRLKKRGSMKPQASKKFKVKKGGSASKYKAKKFKIAKAGKK